MPAASRAVHNSYPVSAHSTFAALPAAQEAKDFLAHLEKQAARQGGGSGSGAGGGKKRGADSSAPRQPPSKAAKASAGGVASGAAGKAQARSGSGKPRQASSSPDASRQLSKSASLPAQRKLQQPEQGQQQQQQQAPKASGVAAAAASHAAVAAASAPLAQAAQQHAQEPQAQRLQREELLAMAEAGVDPSHPAASGEDTMQLSPMAQVAQSPFRKAPLAEAPVAGSGHLPDVKPERVSPLPLDQPAAAGGTTAGDNGNGRAATHSPARMSCADASPAPHRQLAAGAGAAAGAPAAPMQQASGAQQGSGAEAQQALPDPLTLANDEDGVYHAMSRLLALVASTGALLGRAACGEGLGASQAGC